MRNYVKELDENSTFQGGDGFLSIQTSRTKVLECIQELLVLGETSAYSNPTFQGRVAHRFFDSEIMGKLLSSTMRSYVRSIWLNGGQYDK